MQLLWNFYEYVFIFFQSFFSKYSQSAIDKDGLTYFNWIF